MTDIAFIGLGQMGSPMASRLLDAGHDVTVWNRTAEKAAPLVERGARAAHSPADAATHAEVVITMVSDPDALEQVLFGADGVAAGVCAGQMLIDMSTVGPATVASVRERLPEGVTFVDAPVRGSVGEAAEGRLIVLVGAEPDAFERVEPILRTFGTPTRVGGPGAGSAMKLVANLALGAATAAAAEAIALGDALGLGREAALDALESTPLGGVVTSKRESIVAGSYPPRFKLALALKDVQLANEAAADGGRELPIALAVQRRFREAADAGLGGQDYSAVIASIAPAPGRSPG